MNETPKPINLANHTDLDLAIGTLVMFGFDGATLHLLSQTTESWVHLSGIAAMVGISIPCIALIAKSFQRK